MRIDVKLNGMDEVGKAMEHAHVCVQELDQAVSAVYAALHNVGAEITQPPEKPAVE